MSKQVDFDKVTRRGYRGRLINWEKWCDGQAHQLEQGVDYQGTRTDSTRSAGIQWAARHGLKVQTAILSNTSFVFQVTGGLSDEQIATAKRLQELEAGHASDEQVQAELRRSRQGAPSDELTPDPLGERQARVAAEIEQAGGAEEYVRVGKRPGSRERT